MAANKCIFMHNLKYVEYPSRMLHSNTNETYKCTNTVCKWEDDRKNIDWGYLTNSTGNCTFCINLCDQELFCQAVECGNGYCSWWKNDKCNHPYRLDKTLETCTKISFSNGKGNCLQNSQQHKYKTIT